MQHVLYSSWTEHIPEMNSDNSYFEIKKLLETLWLANAGMVMFLRKKMTLQSQWFLVWDTKIVNFSTISRGSLYLSFVLLA